MGLPLIPIAMAIGAAGLFVYDKTKKYNTRDFARKVEQGYNTVEGMESSQLLVLFCRADEPTCRAIERVLEDRITDFKDSKAQISKQLIAEFNSICGEFESIEAEAFEIMKSQEESTISSAVRIKMVQRTKDSAMSPEEKVRRNSFISCLADKDDLSKLRKATNSLPLKMFYLWVASSKCYEENSEEVFYIFEKDFAICVQQFFQDAEV